MLKPYDLVMYDLRSYASPKAKLTQMIRKGEIIRIARGVYADSFDDPRLPVTGMLVSPSYVSFETALGYYGFIPERVHAIKSAGFNLNKEKRFDTPFGLYTFHYIPRNVFPLALTPAEEQGHGFRLAQKEKALLDTLYKIRGITTKKGISDLLFEDLRINELVFEELDWELLSALAPYSRSTTINTLIRLGRYI